MVSPTNTGQVNMSQLKLLQLVVVIFLSFPLLIESTKAAESAPSSDTINSGNGAKAVNESGIAPVMILIPGKNYEIGKYDVTQAEWRAIMGNNPSYFAHCGDDCPVEQVSWNDAQEFIQRLSSKTGRQYRLPTEAEWEYACYGGSQTEYCVEGDPSSVSWYDIEFRSGSQFTTRPVGQERANGYGLYDMNGSVWQWMRDCRNGTCARHKLRGGSWYDISQYLRAPFRLNLDVATNRDRFIGFRLARTIVINKEVAKFKEPVMVFMPGKKYEIGKFEVTQAEWRDLMGSNPSRFKSCGDNCPVEQVSWNDVQEYIQRLNAKTGKHYRLPSEDEWEYACYGGSKTEFCGGNNIDTVAWYGRNSNGTTHPVSKRQANSYGLYDMSGNVWQWMNDCWNSECSKHVLRGGSWGNLTDAMRASFRSFGSVADRNNIIGFRLARTLP